MIKARSGRRLLTSGLALSWALTGFQAVSASGDQTPSQGRLVAILIDDLHIEFKLTPSVRTMLRAISSSLLRDGDQFAVRSTGYSQLHLRATSDQPRFAEAILKVQGAGLSDRDVVSRDSAVANTVKGRAATRSLVIQELLGDLRSIMDRRKVLLCISPEPCAAAAAPLAGGANVLIYTADPRRFVSARAEFEGLVAKINADIR